MNGTRKYWIDTMNMNKITEKIAAMGIIPVVTVDSPEQGVRIIGALSEGGLLAAEVTFRTRAAAEAIHAMKEVCPEALLGAGTVLTLEQVDQALTAGAAFIVSPGSTKEVIEYCVEKGVPVIPGCMTPSDIQLALSCGLDIVKFFPAEAAGGLKLLKAMSAPYPNVRFMPTGGISLKNAADYLTFPKVICCGGSWITEAAKQGDYTAVVEAAKEAVSLVRELWSGR